MCKGKEIKLKERKKPFLRQAMKTHEEKVWEREKERTHFEIWVWCKWINKNKKTKKEKKRKYTKNRWIEKGVKEIIKGKEELILR